MAKKVDRSIRLARAKTLIIAHPSWGRARVNKELRKQYGVGLRTIDVQRLKDATLIGRPKASTGRKSVEAILAEALITPERVTIVGFDEAYMRLRSSGFINAEIRHIFSAGNVPALFSTEPFKIMLRNRRVWFKDKRKRGWSKVQIIDAIKRYYTPDVKGDPFDFLREVYPEVGTRLRIDFKTYRKTAAKRARKQVKKLYKR